MTLLDQEINAPLKKVKLYDIGMKDTRNNKLKAIEYYDQIIDNAEPHSKYFSGRTLV